MVGEEVGGGDCGGDCGGAEERVFGSVQVVGRGVTRVAKGGLQVKDGNGREMEAWQA